jgi:hypothetical protein
MVYLWLCHVDCLLWNLLTTLDPTAWRRNCGRTWPALRPLSWQTHLFIRRSLSKQSWVAALDADLPAEALRHFSKVLEASSRTPLPRLACMLRRRAAGWLQRRRHPPAWSQSIRTLIFQCQTASCRDVEGGERTSEGRGESSCLRRLFISLRLLQHS